MCVTMCTLFIQVIFAVQSGMMHQRLTDQLILNPYFNCFIAYITLDLNVIYVVCDIVAMCVVLMCHSKAFKTKTIVLNVVIFTKYIKRC